MPNIKKKQTDMLFQSVFQIFQKSCLQKSLFSLTLSAQKRFTGIVICPGTVIFKFDFLMGGKFFKPYTHIFQMCYRGKSKCFEWSGDTDSESMRFQFGRGTYTRLSQSMTHCTSCTMYNTHCTPCTIHTAHLVQYTLHTSYNTHCTPCTIHSGHLV